jgi:hypothetical protein
MDDKKVSAVIKIADRKYPMMVARESEKKFRDAEKLIKVEMDKYVVFDKDMLDKLSMVLLRLAIQLLDYKKLSDDKPLRSEVERIDHKLGIYLERQQGSLENIE